MAEDIMVVSNETSVIEALEKAYRDFVPTRAELKRIRGLWRAKVAAVMKSEALPAMRAITPVRSGRGRRSLRVKAISSPFFGLAIGPGAKGFYLAFLPGLTQRYKDIVNDVYRRHGDKALDEAIDEVLSS